MSWPGSPRIRMRPIGPGSPMRMLGAPRSTLARRRVGQVGPVAFARVDDQHAAPRAPPSSSARQGAMAARSSDTSLPSDLAEAARLEEVALHVDDAPARSPRGRSRSVRARRPPATVRIASRGRPGLRPQASDWYRMLLCKKQTSACSARTRTCGPHEFNALASCTRAQ